MNISLRFLEASFAALVVCLAILLRYPLFFLNAFGGRLESTPKTAWANYGDLNNDKCWKNTGFLLPRFDIGIG
jgi:hypothetical protein